MQRLSINFSVLQVRQMVYAAWQAAYHPTQLPPAFPRPSSPRMATGALTSAVHPLRRLLETSQHLPADQQLNGLVARRRGLVRGRTPAAFSTHSSQSTGISTDESSQITELPPHDSLSPQLRASAALAATFFIGVGSQLEPEQLCRNLEEYPWHLSALGYKDALRQVWAPLCMAL